jgi:hypothetical protein
MLPRTPRQHLLEAVKAITVISTVFTTLILSYNLESYAACTQLDKQALSLEKERIKMLEGLKTTKELEVEFDTEVENKKPENNSNKEYKAILKAVKDFRTNKQNILEVTSLETKGAIQTGTISEKEKVKYIDETYSLSTNEFTFIYNIDTKQIALTPKPFVFPLGEILPEVAVPEEAQKASVARKNAMAKLPVNNRGKDDPTFVDKEFKKELEQLKKDATCTGIKARAAQTDYMWAAAVTYARKYAINYNPNFANYTPGTPSNFGGDCTNFASQNMYAGGIKMDGNYLVPKEDFAWYSYRQPWGAFDPVSVSQTFRHVDSFRRHMYHYEYTSYYSEFYGNYRLFDFLQSGDLMFMDMNNDGTFDHSMTITGWDTINGHYEPKLTYHTKNYADRKFADLLRDYPNARYQGLQVYSSR